MELRTRRPARRLTRAAGGRSRARRLARSAGRLILAVAALFLAVGAAVPAPAAADAEVAGKARSIGADQSDARLKAKAIRVAGRTDQVRSARRRHPDLRPAAYPKGFDRWQVSYFSGRTERVQILVHAPSGVVIEAWTGPQVRWKMARGYEGAFGRKLNAPYIWLPLCLLFLAPFFDPRRPLRLLHLDLLVLLAFGVSHFFFNRGEISTSVPLVYPVLAYLLVRMLFAAFRPRPGRGPLIPVVPVVWVALAAVFLVGFRVGLNVIDSNVIDVGYAGVIGADRIADGDPLYEGNFARDNQNGGTYGPLNYLLYLPFEQALPWSGDWDDLPAAHGAAIAFDLVTVVGLFFLGGRLRPGRQGRELGVALAFAWAAYPYTAFTLSSNANDSAVAMLLVLALLALSSAPARGALLGLGAAVKFAPLALAPLFARGTGRQRPLGVLLFTLALGAVLAAAFVPFLPDGGLRELYDRTVGYQAGRESPFSVWGQAPSLDWLQTTVKVGAAGLALAVAFVPRRRSPAQVAALGAAVIIALQLTVDHWFYLYIVWFAPFAFVALFAAHRAVAPAAPTPPAAPVLPAERPPQTVPA